MRLDPLARRRQSVPSASINVSLPREAVTGTVFRINCSNGGVPKLPVERAYLTAEGLLGDRQKHTDVHGGPERALCIYSAEIIERLRAEGHPIAPGTAGENVTLAGFDWSAMLPGTRLRLGGEVEVEITRYTAPCKNIAGSFFDGRFTRISQKVHPGWSRVYARVLREGWLVTGQTVELVRPGVPERRPTDALAPVR
jgi:MOSC domain-containing protein YiiM